MKRVVILLVVLGLLIVFPATAVAKKPISPKPIPPDGVTCAEAGYPGDLRTGDFVVTLTRDAPTVCIDVLSAAGDWEFTVDTSGRVNMLWMVVKDSQPGDFCYPADLWRKTIPDEVVRWVQAAAPNACYGDGYSDNAKSLVFATQMKGSGSVTVTVDLP